MRFVFISMLVAVAAVNFSCGKKIGPEKQPAESAANSKRTAVVTAATNLVVRANPEKTAVKLGLIPHGAIVEVLQESDVEITIDKITAKWCRISYNGIEGWAFGGYLDLAKNEANALSEESDPRSYVGRSFDGLTPSLKKRTVSSVVLKNGVTFYAFDYDSDYLLMVAEKSGGERMTVTDAIRISRDRKKERLFFPNGECRSGDLKDPILAVASEPGAKDCEYTVITRAWTVDLETNRFSPAMPEGIKCKPVCCGEGCE